MSALRFFFTHTLDRPDLARKLVRLAHPRKLPVVLSRDEVARLLNATTCLKHQAALSVAYGAGLRVVAAALAAALRASAMDLKTPLHLALSYDEEIGCIGVRRLIDMLAETSRRPRLCIIGEPTGMEVATGHKGKTAAHVACVGREGHSALAPLAVNAIHMGCDFVAALREEQKHLVERGARDDAYDIPYSTVHVGRINAGVALTIDDIEKLGLEKTAEIALELAWKDADAVYISFDVDSVDCGFVPGTGWPEPGGFLPREALKLLGLVSAPGLCGLEVVEVSPPYDTSDITALFGVRVVVEALGSMVAHGNLGKHRAIIDKPVSF